MLGYQMQTPKEIPKIVWACKTTVDRYCWENRNKENMIEFSLCRSSEQVLIRGDRAPERLSGESFFCLVGDEKCKSYAADGVSVEILSVAVRFERLSYESRELDLEDSANREVLLLPQLQTHMSEQTVARLEMLMYRIVEAYTEHSAASELLCASLVLQMMQELDRVARQGVRAKRDKYVHYYVDKAKAIISMRYAERLTVKEVARELSITPNYLSALFKACVGISFSDCLLEIRMKRAAVLLREENLHESIVAARVGYDELGHFRRRFKQYFGVSIRDYLCIGKEMTLYHDKPQKREE